MTPESSKKLRIVQALPGLVVLALILWGLYASTVGLLGAITDAESSVAAALIAAAVAVIGSVISLAVGKAYETREAIRNDLRQKKTPVYEDIVHMLMYDVMFAKSLGKEPPTEQQLIEFFARITEKLTIWGSDDVLRVYGEFKANAATANDSMQSIFILEDLLLAIRKDLGHRNKGVGRKAILRLFVTDIDRIQPLPNKPTQANGTTRRSR